MAASLLSLGGPPKSQVPTTEWNERISKSLAIKNLVMKKAKIEAIAIEIIVKNSGEKRTEGLKVILTLINNMNDKLKDEKYLLTKILDTTIRSLPDQNQKDQMSKVKEQTLETLNKKTGVNDLLSNILSKGIRTATKTENYFYFMWYG